MNQPIKNETGTQVFALVAALILAAVLASGCSTPPVQGSVNSNDTPAVSTSGYANGSSANASYLRCVQVMTSYGLQNQCYTVSSPTTASYSQYTYSKAGLAKGVSEAHLQASYESYLSSLDAATLSDMNAQWDALVASVSKD